MLRTPPFTRAVTLLRHQPAVLAAVVGAALIVGLVAAATPLFLSSAAAAALQRELDGRCPASVAAHVSVFGPVETTRPLLDQVAARHHHIGPAVLTVEGAYAQVTSAAEPGVPLGARFFIRDGARQHVEVLAASGKPGVWIGERAASQLGVGPGDSIEVVGGNAGGLTVPVAGIYADLDDRIADPYWCAVQGLIEPNAMGDVPPPLLIVDAGYFPFDSAEFDALFATYASVPGWWEIGVVTEDITVEEAAQVVAIFDELDTEIHAWLEEQGAHAQAHFFRPPRVASDLAIVVSRVEALGSALTSSVRPLAAVVLAAALGLMGGAGSYWVERRRNELMMLTVRGVPPGLLALKAVLEVLVPVAVGVIAGWGAAAWLVPAVGPAAVTEASARQGAAVLAAAAGALALLVVAATVRRRSRRLLSPPTTRAGGGSLRLPLAVGFGVAAVGVRRLLGDEAVVVGEQQLVGSVNPLVMLFPLLLFAAAVLVSVELIVRLFPLVRRVGERLGAAPYLASRRITSAPGVAAVLIAATAFPVATLVYSATLTRSATSTVDAKGRTFVGSDAAVPLSGNQEVPDSLRGTATPVVRIPRLRWEGQEVDLLGVDPDTFTEGAFWAPAFAPRPLDELLSLLGETAGDALPAIVVGSDQSEGRLRQGPFELELQAVATANAFPSMHPVRPTVVVDRDLLLQRIAEHGRPVTGTRYYLWVKGMEREALLAALQQAGVRYAFVVEAARTLDQIKYQSVIWTFDFLELYAALAGLIVVAGILLYTDTRQRGRNLAYALARRMGLSRRSHLAAGFLEMAALVVAGAALGAAAARLGALTLYRTLDPVPATPPGPRWVGAGDVVAWALAAAVMVAAVAAWAAQRTADTADTAELLRHAE